ncbi:hypothetical protein DL96DRAFT_1560363 [Flagelloscypha sp. PMI_526]|nr:hypothetical protein DL96DRAFT_1560363 [Flagelloscypha sp. PMI_526]
MHRPRRRYVVRTYLPYPTPTPLEDDREIAWYSQAGLRRSVGFTRAQIEREYRKNLALTANRQPQLRNNIATPSSTQADAIVAKNALLSAAGGHLEDAMSTSNPPDTGDSASPMITPNTNDEGSAWVDEPDSILPGPLFTNDSVKLERRGDLRMRNYRAHRQKDLFNAQIKGPTKPCKREDSRENDGGSEKSGHMVIYGGVECLCAHSLVEVLDGTMDITISSTTNPDIGYQIGIEVVGLDYLI